MSGLLKTNVWSWGRAESEITAPYPTALVFWKTASAPYRALALRLFSRLCVSESSPVLVAGAGVPLLKLWALATRHVLLRVSQIRGHTLFHLSAGDCCPHGAIYKTLTTFLFHNQRPGGGERFVFRLW